MDVDTEREWSRLTELRRRIDEIDASIISALAARYRIAADVGRLKGRAAMPALDPRREAEIVRRASESAREAGLPEEGVRQLFWTLLDCCRGGLRSAAEGVAPDAAMPPGAVPGEALS